MKASKASIARAVDQPDPQTRLYLFLGPDEAQSRALAARFLENLGAAKFVIAAGEIRSNPAVLADEAAALSLFGERRLIWVDPAGNEIVEGVEALFDAEAVESPTVAIAGALTKASPLLKLAEASPHALAFTAYAPESEEAGRVVAALGRRVGLTMSPPVAARVASSCGGDQAIAAQELEKLALYIGASPNSPMELEHDALDAVGADSGEGDFLRLADVALLGDSAELAQLLTPLAGGGSEAIQVLRSLQRRLMMLAPARARFESGERLDDVMASFGKTLFWKDKPLVGKMLKNWTADELARLAERAGMIERNLMFTDVPEADALGEELLTIARKARSRSA